MNAHEPCDLATECRSDFRARSVALVLHEGKFYTVYLGPSGLVSPTSKEMIAEQVGDYLASCKGIVSAELVATVAESLISQLVLEEKTFRVGDITEAERQLRARVLTSIS